ncbi:hypothetical protein [Methanocella arvoryzae]|nr:hypothetical protein [Methanocella arvoryzae]
MPAADQKGQKEKVKADKALADHKIKASVKHLNIYIKLVSKSKLSDSEKALLISQAEENLAWFMQMNQDVQTATMPELVHNIATDVDMHSDILESDIKRNAGLLTSDSIDQKIAAARDVSALAEQKIAAAGLDADTTLKLNRLLADYNGHIDAAAQHTEAAKANFNNITSPVDSDHYYNAGYAELQQAEKELNLAYADLKELYRILLGAR